MIGARTTAGPRSWPLACLLAALVSASTAVAQAPAPPKPASATPVPKGPGGDPRPTAQAGEPVGRVDLALTTNLLAVDEAPKTIDRTLAPAPAAGVDVSALPAGEWLHGAVPLTKTESVPMAVAFDRKALYVDSDRDGKLEANERSMPDGVLGGFAWFPAHALVRQEFEGRKFEHDVALKVGVALNTPQLRSRLDCYRAGVYKGKTREVKLAIEDRTFRGWFTHPGVDAILVDVNGDGKFDASSDSTERYRLGEPIPLDGFDAVVTSIAPLGASLTLARSVKPARIILSLHIGAPAPEFEVNTLDGAKWKLADQRGKWVLLDFWATWCGPCRAEMPNLKRARAEHADLLVLGLSADRARAALEQYLVAQAIDWPQVFEGAQGVQRLYRVAAYPTSFLIDPDGKIAARDLRGSGLSEQIGRLKAARKAGGAAVKPAARSK